MRFGEPLLPRTTPPNPCFSVREDFFLHSSVSRGVSGQAQVSPPCPRANALLLIHALPCGRGFPPFSSHLWRHWAITLHATFSLLLWLHGAEVSETAGTRGSTGVGGCWRGGVGVGDGVFWGGRAWWQSPGGGAGMGLPHAFLHELRQRAR